MNNCYNKARSSHPGAVCSSYPDVVVHRLIAFILCSAGRQSDRERTHVQGMALCVRGCCSSRLDTPRICIG